MNASFVFGITGGSGAVFAVRLLDVLCASGYDVHLAVSKSGAAVLKQELEIEVDPRQVDPSALRLEATPLAAAAAARPIWQDREADRVTELIERPRGRERGSVVCHAIDNYMAPIASGSFLSGGMVICPCSGATMSAIAHGASTNLIQRAADVQLKERRKLILVPRETPLGSVHLENMRRASDAGAIVLPAMPGWYHGVQGLFDLVDFLVARICDQLGVAHHLMRRWGEPGTGEGG